jgi:hypothetical protein
LAGNGRKPSSTGRAGKIERHALVAPRAGLCGHFGLFPLGTHAYGIAAPAHDPFDRFGLALGAGQIDPLVRGQKKLFKKITARRASEFENGHLKHS